MANEIDRVKAAMAQRVKDGTATKEQADKYVQDRATSIKAAEARDAAKGYAKGGLVTKPARKSTTAKKKKKAKK